MYKNVKYLIPAYDVDMGGVMVRQSLPTLKVNKVDPFLLLHHARFSYTENAPAIHQGLGPHPHRGFTPVSFVIDGEVHHRDSRGNNQIAKKGEVQWMHAGAGIIHSERPSQALANENGAQEVVQLWINSPSAKKMQEPSYQYLSEADIPSFLSEDRQVSNKLIAGVALNEKVAQQGPFVMNSETEILEAMRDYQMGKMGILIEEK